MKTPLDTLQSIRQRRTVKVVSDTPLPTKPCDEHLIETLLESAYYAPFHYPCSAPHQQHLPSVLPWRFYVLDSTACRQLARTLVEEEIAVGKIVGMLNSADYLIQATWCPQSAKPTHEESLFDGDLVNMEHLAAAGAAIQNVLISATALGHENYWSSGGPLRNSLVFKKMAIPVEEILLGALFIFPSENETDESVAYLPSKRRDKRGSLGDSYRFVNLPL